MSKNSFLKIISLFLGIMLCAATIPASFAQIENIEKSAAGPASTTGSNKIVIHEINPGYFDLYLQQGESSSFTVSFKNNGKKSLDIEPKIASVPYSIDFNESWISISPANVTVEAGAEQEFTVEVNIPEDAGTGYYETYIAFTDDVYSEEDYYPQYVNAMYLSISVSAITHEINPAYYDLYLRQGDNEVFNVSFKNNGNKALEIEPKVVDVPYSVDFNESWISVFPANVTVEAGAEQEFTVEVSIPEDEEGGYYEACIAFTDDVYSEEDPYPQYINSMYLSISVPVYPKLELQTNYIDDTVEAGKEYEYTVKIKNVAGKNITIDPEVTGYSYSFDEFGLDDDEIEITAPSTLEPGEIADMIIRVPVPENATGTYDRYIEMNVNGGENGGYEPQLELYLTVMHQPSVPYVKTFSTKNEDQITIEVSTYSYGSDSWLRNPPRDEVPSFELSMKYNSTPIDMTLVKTTMYGDVSIGGDYFPSWPNDEHDIYQSSGSYYTETYVVSGAIGDWELEILPKNAQNFHYSISIGDSK